MSEEIKHCELCDQEVTVKNTCDHPKNSYCAIYLLQAEIDKVKFKVKEVKP